MDKEKITELRKKLPKPLKWEYNTGQDAVIPYWKGKPCTCISHLYSETQVINLLKKAQEELTNKQEDQILFRGEE